ncbi:MAG: hypothetical protein ABSB40_05690 [Nitrososphaeria archaeon]|jgi:hypothetical protein
MKKDDRCYINYIPWERELPENDLKKKVLTLGPDEGIRISAELCDGRTVKIFVNKTGLEHVITLIYDNGKERISSFKGGIEAYNALFKQIKNIRNIILY